VLFVLFVSFVVRWSCAFAWGKSLSHARSLLSLKTPRTPRDHQLQFPPDVCLRVLRGEMILRLCVRPVSLIRHSEIRDPRFPSCSSW